MFEISFLLFLKHLFFNLVLPILPWILFIYIFFWTKFKWVILYLLSFFVWTWVVAFSIFNLQIVHFWIWITEYFWLLLFLTLWFILKIYLRKNKLLNYVDTLKIKFNSDLLKSYKKLSLIQKVWFYIMSLFVSVFIVITFIFSINFPSYADDTFPNWHRPVMNIYQDGWVKVFWSEDEILWRWRLGYPIFIPIYKVVIVNFVWWFNDIYINLWQYLLFLFFLLFVFNFSFSKTNNLFLSILPIFLVIWLPLVFFHCTEGYMDLPSAIYSVLVIYFLYKYLSSDDYDMLSLWLLFGFILSNIKNDWLIVYFSWIIIAFAVLILITKKVKQFFKWFLKNKNSLYSSIFFALYFLLPFIIIKSYYGIWYNQASWEVSWVTFSFHPEIFSMLYPIFFNENNYNLILILFILVTYLVFKNLKSYIKSKMFFLYLSFLCIFSIFFIVFLFTSNYTFMMDQTTVNRVFTMCFIILCSFSSLLITNEN